MLKFERAQKRLCGDAADMKMHRQTATGEKTNRVWIT